jgi:hypothetical protein
VWFWHQAFVYLHDIHDWALRIDLLEARRRHQIPIALAASHCPTPRDFVHCAGFSDACITKPSTRSDDRRPRSAKARNRGPEGAGFRRRDLWGFEGCGRQFSRGRNDECAGIRRVDGSRGACAAGVGMRFGAGAAIASGRRTIIGRAASALASGERPEWQERRALGRGRQGHLDHEVSILMARGAVVGR